MPRWGLISGTRRLSNSKPLARSGDSSIPPRKDAARFTKSKAACLSWASRVAGSMKLEQYRDQPGSPLRNA
jgi:hypothetical protein